MVYLGLVYICESVALRVHYDYWEVCKQLITDSPIPSLQLYLSGRPNGPEISSDVESNYSDQFNLTWRVESFAEITAYRIIYRKYLVRSWLPAKL